MTATGRRMWMWRESSGKRHQIGSLQTPKTPDGLDYEEAASKVMQARVTKQKGGDAAAVIMPRGTPTTLRKVIETYVESGRVNDDTARRVRSSVRPLLDGWTDLVTKGDRIVEVVYRAYGGLPIQEVTAKMLFDVTEALHLTPRDQPEVWRRAAANRLVRNVATAIDHCRLPSTGILPEAFPNVAELLTKCDERLRIGTRKGYKRALSPEQIVALRQAVRDAIAEYRVNARRAHIIQGRREVEVEIRHPLGFLLIEFCLLVGCRPGEAAKLRCDAIDGDQARVGKHKNSRRQIDRILYISAEAKTVVSEADAWRRREGLNTSPYVFAGPGRQRDKQGYIRHAWAYAATLAKRTGIHLTAHSMRSIHINALRRVGRTAEQIAPVVGHLRAKTTMEHYVEVSEEEVRDTLAAANDAFKGTRSRESGSLPSSSQSERDVMVDRQPGRVAAQHKGHLP
ncbi:tyrosine-type recombinase/integrase [Siccirubricoccus deserti]